MCRLKDEKVQVKVKQKKKGVSSSSFLSFWGVAKPV